MTKQVEVLELVVQYGGAMPIEKFVSQQIFEQHFFLIL